MPQPIPTDEVYVLPTSFAQQRMWFLNQLEPESPVYNMPTILRLRGKLDIWALQQTLNEIVMRHEVLRTTFTTVDAQPVQVILPLTPVDMPLTDLSQLSHEAASTQMLAIAEEEARRPFDLVHGPLLRVHLMRIQQQEHVLTLVIHHIVCDGWSMGILIREVGLLYEAFKNQQPSPLAPLAIQYADFAHWQREWLQGATLKTQLDFWQAQLQGKLPVLDLPTDRPRGTVPTSQGAIYKFTLPVRLTQKLTELSRHHNATLFMVLLAAFQTLLYRYTGQTDILVGSLIANRNRADIEHLIGFFVNTLVIRTNLKGNPTFQELLGKVRETTLQAYAHQDVPFERVVEAVQPVRLLSHTPIFQVVFAMQNAPTQPVSLSEISLEPIEVNRGTTKFDITLFIEEIDAGLSGTLEYNTDLFEAATIQRMAGHWQTLLQAAAEAPYTPVNQLPMLTPSEKQQMLVAWNDNVLPYDQTICLHEIINRQAIQQPDAIALIYGEEEMTYADLDGKAELLAVYLRSLGVKPETLVGVFMARTPNLIVALLGILKAGGAYIPLDPMYPPDRIAYMLKDAQAAIVLTQSDLLSSLPTAVQHILSLDSEWEAIAQAMAVPPAPNPDPLNLAYVIYTSGSTGHPKGIAIPHRTTVAMLTWAMSFFTKDLFAGVLGSTSICFDVSILEIFGTLCSGGTLVLADTPLHLHELPAAEKITMVNMVPSAMRELLRLGPLPHSVRFANLGGEALKTQLVNDIYAGSQVKQVMDMYGPSEYTTYSTCACREAHAPATIGRPIGNASVYILDATFNPVPVGVSGELYVSGEGLTRGYLNKPGLTAARYLPNPFSNKPGERLYAVGDVARYRPDGEIEFLGRVDHQVKVRGFRIELGEIEAVLLQHDAITECVLVAQNDEAAQTQMVAYYSTGTASSIPVNELRSYLRTSLPEYMIPSIFVHLDMLPQTPNGKVDRLALPTPDGERPDVSTTFVAPQNELQAIIASIWCQSLHLDSVGIYDNFFDLGGHSLLIIQIQEGLQMELKQKVPLLLLFQYPTIHALAQHLAEAKEATVAVDTSYERGASRQKQLQARRQQRKRAGGGGA